MSELQELLRESGTEIARVDDTAYLVLRAVYACTNGQTPSLYCLESDWAAQPARRLAELLRINDRLVARVAELEIRLSERETKETPLQNQSEVFRAQAACIGGESTPPSVADPGACPDCGEDGWKNARSLQMHRQRSHQGMRAMKAAPVQFVEELGWHCAAKGCAGAHARSLTDPAFCTLHAAPRTNGHAVLP